MSMRVKKETRKAKKSSKTITAGINLFMKKWKRVTIKTFMNKILKGSNILIMKNKILNNLKANNAKRGRESRIRLNSWGKYCLLEIPYGLRPMPIWTMNKDKGKLKKKKKKSLQLFQKLRS